MFFKGSHYENVETDSITNAQGQVVKFKKVRFIPDTPAQAAVVVNQGERLDHIAQRIYQDPEIFWRICDTNLAYLVGPLPSVPEKLVNDRRALFIAIANGVINHLKNKQAAVEATFDIGFGTVTATTDIKVRT